MSLSQQETERLVFDQVRAYRAVHRPHRQARQGPSRVRPLRRYLAL